MLFSRSFTSDCLQLHGLQYARIPCPSPSPRACSNSCLSSQWCHPTILSSCHPLLLLPSIFPSIKVFSNDSVLPIRWPKYCSFSFSISPSSEYSGLISFRIDWFDLPAVQGILKCLLQHHNLKASILQHSAFFVVQLSQPYIYWKNHSFDYTDFVGKVTSLLFNMLSTFVLALLPRSKLYMLISKIINLYANLGNHLGRKESDMTEQRNWNRKS